ncbi:MAG: GTP 3',8-cyclase MoaA [Gammaproteobacteria bacterium]
MSTQTTPRDKLHRPIRDLRISVTDRCNFRCTYCMPKDVFSPGYKFLPRKQLLTFEEIERVASAFLSQGVKKIRLTGGEPLARSSFESLVERLARLHGLQDLSMTTNGSLLTVAKARRLKDAGLHRITISLDALDDATFMAINDVEFPVQRVLDAIENAASAGLPLKVNMVVKKGVNDHSILPMARFFRGTGHILRFIEYMDVGNSNGWRLDEVVTASDIAAMIDADMSIEPADPNYRGEVAKRWRYRDGSGEIGIISSVSQPFCGDCTRVRLSAEGQVYTCLFALQGHDLRKTLRDGASDVQLRQRIADIWTARGDRYSELRASHKIIVPKVEMSYIGG